MNITRSFIFILLTAFLLVQETTLALDPKRKLTQYSFDIWTMREGLPQATINTIIQTNDGYIWIGTRSGVVRFDGVKFTTFNTHNCKQLGENEIWALGENKDGLWIGTFGAGIVKFKDGKFTSYYKTGILPDSISRVFTIYRDKDDSMWFGSNEGLIHFKNNVFKIYEKKDGLPNQVIRSIHRDKEDNLWIGTKVGLARYKHGIISPVTVETINSNSILSSIAGHDGSIWIGIKMVLMKILSG
jgi:ligand-binding sensor domain-containing protein